MPSPEQLYKQQLLHEGYHSLQDSNLKTGHRYLLADFKYKEQSTHFIGDSSAFKRLFEFLAKNHEFWFEIAVHDYKYWDQDYKKDVTQSRAADISNYLIMHGIDPQRVFPKGHAFKHPIVSYAEIKPWWGKIDDKQAIQYNERVELVLMRKYKKKTATKNHIKFALESGRTDSSTSRLAIGQQFLVPGMSFDNGFNPEASDFSFIKRFLEKHKEIETYSLIVYDPWNVYTDAPLKGKKGKKKLVKTIRSIESSGSSKLPGHLSFKTRDQHQIFREHYLQHITEPFKSEYMRGNQHVVIEMTKLSGQ